MKGSQRDGKNKEHGRVYRALDFALSIESWKRSFTVPFRRMGKYLKQAKTSASDVYTQTDDLVATSNQREIAEAVKRSKQTAFVYGIFSLIFGVITAFGTSNLAQGLSTGLIFLFFTLLSMTYLYVAMKGQSQLSNGAPNE